MTLTQVIQSFDADRPESRRDVVAAAYSELRRIASARMHDERDSHTLTATALANEVAAELLTDERMPAKSRGQLLAYASRAMRHLLIDHARTRGRKKRGGDCTVVSIDDALIAGDERGDERAILNAALNKLAEADPRKARLIELRFFAGMSNQEIADALGVSPATIKRDWAVAKVRLQHILSLRDARDAAK